MSLKLTTLLAAGAVLTASAARAQAEAPAWTAAPSVADMAAAYPAKAKAAGVGGAVALTCEIGHKGRPHDCTTLGEKPDGYGFGFAARKLAEKLYVADPAMTGKEVRIPVTFDPAVLAGSAPALTQPAWTVLPAAADFQASFPKTANGVNSVRVVLACTVGDGGALADCGVSKEEPAGQGYGQGALALASKFRVGPWSLDGEPTAGAKIRVPIRYELTQVAPPKG